MARNQTNQSLEDANSVLATITPPGANALERMAILGAKTAIARHRALLIYRERHGDRLRRQMRAYAARKRGLTDAEIAEREDKGLIRKSPTKRDTKP